jgi:hypothetical protein
VRLTVLRVVGEFTLRCHVRSDDQASALGHLALHSNFSSCVPAALHIRTSQSNFTLELDAMKTVKTAELGENGEKGARLIKKKLL